MLDKKVTPIEGDPVQVYLNVRDSLVLELKQQASRDVEFKKRMLALSEADFSSLLQEKNVPTDVAQRIAWYGLNQLHGSLKS